MVTASRSASPTGCPKLWTLHLNDSEQQPQEDVLFNHHAQIYFPTQNLGSCGYNVAYYHRCDCGVNE